MSLRTSLLAAVEAARSISGPLGVDIRVNQLTIRTRTWSGRYVGDGISVDSDLVLPAHYPIRYIAASEVSASGGTYEMNDLLVDHITPFDGATVGYTRAQLNPLIATDNVEVIYVIKESSPGSGGHPGEYNLVECRTEKPFSYQLVLRRMRTTP